MMERPPSARGPNSMRPCSRPTTFSCAMSAAISSDSAAGITSRGLNPDLVEDSFPDDSAVAHAIERHAAGQTEIAHPGFAPGKRGHLEHDFFGDVLDGPRKIHLALRERAFGLTRRA